MGKTMVLALTLIVVFLSGCNNLNDSIADRCIENWDAMECKQDYSKYMMAVRYNDTGYCNKIEDGSRRNLCSDYVDQSILLSVNETFGEDFFNCSAYGPLCG